VVTAGDHVRADHTVTHWWRNDTDGPLTVLAVDIYEPHEEPPY
jgi:aspartyl/asparaginyl beta-hydroxylase (cupin superfamily)